MVSYKRCADDDEFAGTHDFSKKILVKQLLMFMLMIIVQPGVTNVGG